jgi:hypothetical protein
MVPADRVAQSWRMRNLLRLAAQLWAVVLEV